MTISDMTKICKSLGDSNRMSIFNILLEKEKNASELLNQLQITQPTLSHHMKILTDCKLIKSEKKGTSILYSVNKDILSDIQALLSVVKNPEENKPQSQEKKVLLTEKETNYQNLLYEIAQKAKKDNEIKNDFFMRMSHDIRIALNGIKGLVLVSRKNKDNLQELQTNIEKINETAMQCESILDEFLDIKEIEQEIKLETPFDIFENAREINEYFSAKCKQKNIRFKAQVIGTVKHPYILCHRFYMKRIYHILLENSLHFTKNNGKIMVTFEETGFTEDTVSHKIIIEDNGIGMDQCMADQLLKPFDPSSASNLEFSSGLGLSLINYLISQIDGSFKLESRLGKGTKVTIEMTLPIDKKAEELFSKNTDKKIKGKRILLVEDNDLNMEIASYILTDAGAFVVTAKTGKEAVHTMEKSVEGEFNIILMDITMPEMNGYAATKIIRTMNRSDSESIPIIAMTANVFEEDIKKCLEAGMNEHIAKPLNIEKVISTLNKWL